jgi:hypothetical protein
LGGWGWENHSSRPELANSSWDLISKISRAKWTGSVAQAVEYLICRCKALISKTPVPPKPLIKKERAHYSLAKKDIYCSIICNALKYRKLFWPFIEYTYNYSVNYQELKLVLPLKSGMFNKNHWGIFNILFQQPTLSLTCLTKDINIQLICVRITAIVTSSA